jgi:hypothetical protein
MTEIPVTFRLDGKEYKGTITSVSGAASGAMFHLNVDKHHWGRLWYVEGHPGFGDGLHAVKAGWRFASNQHPSLSELADYFGEIVTAWFQ